MEFWQQIGIHQGMAKDFPKIVWEEFWSLQQADMWHLHEALSLCQCVKISGIH